jgi:hypothetical protein
MRSGALEGYLKGLAHVWNGAVQQVEGCYTYGDGTVSREVAYLITLPTTGEQVDAALDTLYKLGRLYEQETILYSDNQGYAHLIDSIGRLQTLGTWREVATAAGLKNYTVIDNRIYVAG